MDDFNIEKEWDFESGKLPLDFANTAEFHASDHPDEMLESYRDLVSWAVEADLLRGIVGQELLEKAKREPQEASKALQKAIELREVIFRIISAIAEGAEPDKNDLSDFNHALAGALKKTQISPTADGFEWTWSSNEKSFGKMLWPILRETANLLTSKDISRVGKCADDRGCGYLFFDTSRNHSRRWCSMESCGNRAKAQRHYQRRSKK